MNYPHGKLTDEQIKTTFTQVPLFLLGLALGAAYGADHGLRREEARSKGGELYCFGWPDGSYAELSRLDASKAFDPDVLVELYRATAQAEVQMRAEENNRG